MKTLAILVLVAALLAACDNNTPPTKAPTGQNPQVDNNPVPKSTTGDVQPGTLPKQ